MSAQLKAIQLEVYELITRVAQHRTATPKEIDEALAQAKLPPLPSEPADSEQQKDADAGTQQSGPSQPSREFCALVCVVCVVCVCGGGGGLSGVLWLLSLTHLPSPFLLSLSFARADVGRTSPAAA